MVKRGDIVRPSAKYAASGKAWEGVGVVDCVTTSLYDGKPFVVVHFVVLQDVEGDRFLRKGAYCVDFCAPDEIEIVPAADIGDALLPDREPDLFAGFNLWRRREEWDR